MKNHIIQLLLNGCAVDYQKRLSVCYLPDFNVNRAMYQVHCEDHRLEDGCFSELYASPTKAAKEFMNLKHRLYTRKKDA